MKNTNKVKLLLFTFFVFGLLLFAIPQIGHTSVSEGCCIDEVANTCLGCEGCSVADSYCEEQGGSALANADICVTELGNPVCAQREPNQIGCCVVRPGVCVDNLNSRDCFDEVEFGNFGGNIWNPGSSCDDTPPCDEPTNVPTMNQWGFIALAGILGVIGLFMVIRSRKAEA